MATKAKRQADGEAVAPAVAPNAAPVMERLVGMAEIDARSAVEQFEQQAWAMRPTEHLAVRAALKVLWLIALEVRALRKGEA